MLRAYGMTSSCLGHHRVVAEGEGGGALVTLCGVVRRMSSHTWSPRVVAEDEAEARKTVEDEGDGCVADSAHHTTSTSIHHYIVNTLCAQQG